MTAGAAGAAAVAPDKAKSSGPAADVPLIVGDVVQLADCASPATAMCLQPGDSGLIIATDATEIPYRVRGPNGECNWFPAAWLEHASNATLFSAVAGEDQPGESTELCEEPAVLWVRRAGSEAFNGQYHRLDEEKCGCPVWGKRDSTFVIQYNAFEWRMFSTDDSDEAGYYFIKFAVCDSGHVRPHEACWQVGPGAVEPPPVVSDREHSITYWSQGVPAPHGGFTHGEPDVGELGAAVGLTGDAASSDGYLAAAKIRWGPSAVSGVSYAIGVFEVDRRRPWRASLLTRCPFTSIVDLGHQRVELVTPLCVKAGQHLGVLNLEDDFCSVAYKSLSLDGVGHDDQASPVLFGVDCFSARSFVQGGRVEVVPAKVTLAIEWELQSDLLPPILGTNENSDPRISWTAGPQDLMNDVGELKAPVAITAPPIAEGGRCVGLDVAFATLPTANCAVGVFDLEDSAPPRRARLVTHCLIEVPHEATGIQHIELSTPLQVMPGQYLGVVDLANGLCHVKFCQLSATQPATLLNEVSSSTLVEQLTTGEYFYLGSTSNPLCIQWHMESRDQSDSLGGRTLVPDGTTAFEIIGTDDPDINGIYHATKLRGYAGPEGYRRQHSNLAMFRWHQEHWVLADLGPAMDHFDETSWLYRVPSGKPPIGTPPTSEEWARVPPRSDLPEKLAVLRAIQIGSPDAQLLRQKQNTNPVRSFDAELSCPRLQYSASGTIAERVGRGCFPPAVLSVQGDEIGLTLRILSSTRTGNVFSFGVATKMRTELCDGFGHEEDSVGLMQTCSEDSGGFVKLAWTRRNQRTERELDGIRLEEGMTVSLRLCANEVTFWVNGNLIDTVKAPLNVTVAGCTLHTSGAVQIEPFRFVDARPIATEEGVHVARPAAPLTGSVDSMVNDAGLGKIDILEGPCILLSDESIASVEADSIAWRLRFSGNDSFSIGAISVTDIGRAIECLFEDAEYPLAVNSSGTFGGNLQRLAMSDSDVIVCLNGASRSLDIYTDGSPTPVKSLPWVTDDPEAKTGVDARGQPKMYLALCGFDGCTIDFKPVGKFLSPPLSIATAVPSSEVLCGQSLVEYRVDPVGGTAFVKTGKGPSVFVSKQSVIMGRPEKLAWHCIISSQAGAFSVGALAANEFESQKARYAMHDDPAAPLTINSPGSLGGNQRKCSMMSPQGIIVMLDGEARTLTVHKAPTRVEALGPPVQTLPVPERIDVPLHLAMNGFRDTTFQFVRLDPGLLESSETAVKAHFPLLVGESVELTEHYKDFADAASGPLRPHGFAANKQNMSGTIVRVRIGELGYTNQYQVRVGLVEWWYDVKAVQLVGTKSEEVGSSSSRGRALPELRWSVRGSETGLAITDSGRGVKYNTRREGVRCDLAMHVGKYVWSVKLEEGDRDATIGVCEREADLSCRDYNQPHVWCWELDDGDLNEGKKKKVQGKFMRKPDKGRRVFCHLDTEVGTLGYSVDSGPVKTAFTGLRGRTLYPYGLLGSSNEWSDLSLVEAPDLSKFEIFEVRGAGTEAVNGWYSPISIHRYSGLEPFGKRGNDSIVLMRWERSRWLCVDMGEGRTKFPGHGGQILYMCNAVSDLPPCEGWVAVDGAVPVFRVCGIDGLSQPSYTPSFVAGPSEELAKSWTTPFVQVGSCVGPLFNHETQHCWVNGPLGRVTLAQAAHSEVEMRSELGKRVQPFGPSYDRMPADCEALVVKSFERRYLAQGENSTVTLSVPINFSQNLDRFTLQYTAIRRRTVEEEITKDSSDNEKVISEAKTLLKFDPEISSDDLNFEKDDLQYVERPGTDGCYPAALIAVETDHFALTITVERDTDRGNSFSFGIATDMRNTYGDGFGPERTSVGLIQNCSSNDSTVRFVDSHNAGRNETDLHRRLELGSVVSLVLFQNKVTFYIDGDVVAAADVFDIKYAGCTMNTDGAVSIRPLPENIAKQFSSAPPTEISRASPAVDEGEVEEEEVSFLTPEQVSAMSYEDQFAYVTRLSAQEERRKNRATAAEAAPAAASEEVDTIEKATSENGSVDPTVPHPTGLIRAITTASVFATRGGIFGPDTVILGEIEAGVDVQAITTISEEHVIGDGNNAENSGIASITWTKVPFSRAASGFGWVTENVDGEKIFQRYREEIEEDPPISSSSPFFVQIGNDRFDTLDSSTRCIVEDRQHKGPEMITIGTNFPAALQPGLEYKFTVSYLGEEEAEITIHSDKYMCANGNDVHLKTLATSEVDEVTAVVSWGAILQTDRTVSGVRLGYRVLCDPGRGSVQVLELVRRTNSGRRLSKQRVKDDRLHFPSDVTEISVHGLAPWTPYIFTVAAVLEDGTVLQARESRVFIWVPPEDIPAPEVCVGTTNQSLLVTSNMLDLSDKPAASSVLGAATYRILQKVEGDDEAFEPIGPPLKLFTNTTRSSAAKLAAVNYWNPHDKHESILLRKDNTEITYRTSTGRNAVIRAKFPLARGQHYWETTIVKFDGGGSGYNFLGVATGAVNVQAVLSSTNAGPGIWAIQLGDEMKRFRNGRDRERWMSCKYETGLKIGLLVDTVSGTMDVFVNNEKRGTAFVDLPRSEPVYPCIGVGCLVPNVYRTDFAAVMPPTVSMAPIPDHGVLSLGGRVFSAPSGERTRNHVPRGTMGYFVKDVSEKTCIVNFPEDVGHVEVPFSELGLPCTSVALATGSHGREVGDVDVLRSVVRVMTSLDANQVTQHLLERTAHLESVPAASGNDFYWRQQIKEVTEGMLAGYQRSEFALRRRRHEEGIVPLSAPDLTIVDTALKSLPAPYVATVSASPGNQFTFKTEVTLGLSGSSVLLAANAPLVSAARGGDFTSIKAAPRKGDRVQLSDVGDKERCLAPSSVGVVVDCVASCINPIKVRSSDNKISHYRPRDLAVVGPIPVLVKRPILGDLVQLAQFATDRHGCLLSSSDIGIIVRDEPTDSRPFCVSCNGDIHRYSLLDLEVCKGPHPSSESHGPRVLEASSNVRGAKAALLDDSDNTFWETSGNKPNRNKPHWVLIKLPRRFERFSVKTHPFGGSYEAHRISVRACAESTTRSSARRVVPEVFLPTDVDSIYPLFKSSDLLPEEDCIYFEILGCGPNDTATNCKVRGFHLSGIGALSGDERVTLPGASSSWILEHPRSRCVDYTVPYKPPTAPVSLSLTRLPQSNDVELSWQPPKYDGGQPVLSYRVKITTASNVIYTESPRKSDVQWFETFDPRLVLPNIAPLSHCTCVVSALNAVGEGPPSEKPAQLRKGDVIVLPGGIQEEDPSGIQTLVSRPFVGDVWRLRSAPTSSIAFSKVDMNKACVDTSLQQVSIFHVLATSPDTYDLQRILLTEGVTSSLPAALALTNNDGRTPLLVAAASLNVQAVHLFLDALEAIGNASVTAKVAGAADNSGNTAAHHLATIETSVTTLPNSDVCATLLARLAKYASPLARNAVGETVFTRALKYGNVPLASWMIRSRVFVEGANALDGAGNSALHLGTLLLLNKSTSGGSSLRFTFDEDHKSPQLSLGGDCREVVRNDLDGTRSIRLLPALSCGRHTVSFRILRSRSRDGGLGTGYYIGIVDPAFDNWDGRIHQPPLGYGMEDDNSSSSRRWNFPKNSTGHAFHSGDILTFDVDFEANTIEIVRNKGAPGECRMTTTIPPTMESFHFAMTLYNTDATCEILDIGREYGLDAVPEKSSDTEEELQVGIVDALCDVVEHLQSSPGLMEQPNNYGVTPTELVLFSTLTDVPSESAASVAHARRRLGELFFGNAGSCISMLKGSGGALPTVYNSLSSAFFDSIVEAMRVTEETSVIQPFVRATAIIYAQCFANTLLINEATALDDVGSRILKNIRRTFEAFPHFAILEIGECARALAEPLLSNAVIPLKVQMNPCRGSTVLRRPPFAGEPKTHTVTEFVSTNLAPREAYKEIIKEIAQIGATWDQLRIDALDARLASVADINTLRSTSSGISLLHFVCDMNRLELVHLLLRHNCDINARNSFGEVPLHTAVKAGHRDVVSLLLQQSGVLTSVRTHEDGLTPLHLSCSKDIRMSATDRLAVVRSLLQGGADATALSTSGLSPLDLAGRNNFSNCLAEIAAWPVSVVLSDARNPSSRSSCDRVLRATVVEVSDNAQPVDGGDGYAAGSPAPETEDGLSEEELARRREEEDLELARLLQEEENRTIRRGGGGGREAAERSHGSSSTSGMPFGTWLRHLSRAESRKSSVRTINMQERLALATARLVKEQVKVLDGLVSAREERRCVDVSVIDVQSVFLALTNELWAYVATAMDCFEANLRAGLEHAKQNDSKKARVPTNQDDLADMYMASLLDNHNGGLIQVPPCTDVTAHGHVAVLVDALMLALPRLQSGSDQSLVSPSKKRSSPFFRRTESISVAGAHDGEITLELPVSQVLPLAHNPFLLMSRRGEKFGGQKTEPHCDSPIHRHSGRIDEVDLPGCVSGQEVVRVWTGPPENATSRKHQGWESAVNFDQAQSLESTFLSRWQTSLEIMASEYAHFFSEGERPGFFSSALMRLLSVEAKQKIFAERLKMHPKRGKNLVRFDVSRKNLLESSAKAIGREFEKKKFPMIIENVKFSDERGIGEGVTRGWWTAVSTALGQASAIFDPALAGSPETVTLTRRMVESGDGSSEFVWCIKLPGVPMIPHRNPIFVKWLIPPADSDDKDVDVKFVEVSSEAGGCVVLSNGAKFDNPTNHAALMTPYRHMPARDIASQPDLEWAACGPGLRIDANKTTVAYAKSRCGCIGNLGFKDGEHVFEVTLHEGDRDAAFGVAAVDVVLDTRDNVAPRTWVWVLNDKYLCEDGSKVAQERGAGFYRQPQAKDIVRCYVNADKGTVAFQINDEAIIPAFDGLKSVAQKDGLFPFCKLGSSNVWTNLRYVEGTSKPILYPGPRFQRAGSCQQLFHEPGNRGFYSPCVVPESEWTLELEAYYRFAGRFVALALFSNTRIWFRLSRHVIKYMLRKPVQWHDLAFYSTEKYEKYRKYIANPKATIQHEDTFEIDLQDSGGLRLTELKPGGADVAVLPENVEEFVELSARTLMIDSVQRPLNALRAGLEDVFPVPSILDILTAEDFAVILNGSPEIETALLRNQTECSGANKKWYDDFWNVVEKMTAMEKSNLLGFWTGSACVPSDLSRWKLRLEVHRESQELPEAATCSRQLRIPKYSSPETLRTKIQLAIQECSYMQA